MKMRICIDIDGTICELKNIIGNYSEVKPLPGAKEFIKKCRARGDYIILYTARHMKTCGGNVGRVIKKEGLNLLQWLEREDIEYDEIYFGKPQADVYIDDNAFRFNGTWNCGFIDELSKIESSESNFKMNIVITMAGAGSRFAKAGYTLPKPLIPIFGTPMYRYSVNSLPLSLAAKLIFVIQRGEFSELIKKDIRENYSSYNYEIVELEALTRGQAETLFLARGALRHNIPTLIHNSDSAVDFKSAELEELLKLNDGALVTFESNSPNYSYARINSAGEVQEVREKKVISKYASTGTYYFKSTVNLISLLEEMLENNERESGEFYIAPLYNKLIDEGKKVGVLESRNYLCYGTPDELNKIKLDDLRLFNGS